jgi:hypothetical protein
MEEENMMEHGMDFVMLCPTAAPAVVTALIRRKCVLAWKCTFTGHLYLKPHYYIIWHSEDQWWRLHQLIKQKYAMNISYYSWR